MRKRFFAGVAIGPDGANRHTLPPAWDSYRHDVNEVGEEEEVKTCTSNTNRAPGAANIFSEQIKRLWRLAGEMPSLCSTARQLGMPLSPHRY
ncbi:hypothetical protein [Microbulbifer magnicolonia]|uniref:hypothetical protein n=1 Tax=Microbulbifer magnicolonia TaxID=3109744 RepID=UPI002B415CDC|nr:hypothetical protein [Microbulbifer sp. GG15]